MEWSIACNLEDEATGYYATVNTNDPSILMKMIAWVLDGASNAGSYANCDSHGGILYNGSRHLDIGFISPAGYGEVKKANDPSDTGYIYLKQWFARRSHDADEELFELPVDDSIEVPVDEDD